MQDGAASLANSGPSEQGDDANDGLGASRYPPRLARQSLTRRFARYRSAKVIVILGIRMENKIDGGLGRAYTRGLGK